MFPLFGQLPIEIRWMIWHFALEAEWVLTEPNTSLYLPDCEKTPAPARACREARNELMKGMSHLSSFDWVGEKIKLDDRAILKARIRKIEEKSEEEQEEDNIGRIKKRKQKIRRPRTSYKTSPTKIIWHNHAKHVVFLGDTAYASGLLGHISEESSPLAPGFFLPPPMRIHENNNRTATIIRKLRNDLQYAVLVSPSYSSSSQYQEGNNDYRGGQGREIEHRLLEYSLHQLVTSFNSLRTVVILLGDDWFRRTDFRLTQGERNRVITACQQIGGPPFWDDCDGDDENYDLRALASLIKERVDRQQHAEIRRMPNFVVIPLDKREEDDGEEEKEKERERERAARYDDIWLGEFGPFMEQQQFHLQEAF